eukprot:1148733-Pelagomonas_calceolata.AAC.7
MPVKVTGQSGQVTEEKWMGNSTLLCRHCSICSMTHAARATMQLELTAALDQAEAAQGEADEASSFFGRKC